MKTITSLTGILFALALWASPSLVRADDKACCEATVEAGKKCSHSCCVKAAEKGKVCEKCHKKDKEEKK